LLVKFYKRKKSSFEQQQEEQTFCGVFAQLERSHLVTDMILFSGDCSFASLFYGYTWLVVILNNYFNN